MTMMLDGQLVAQPLFSPAADRNKQAILQVLQRTLPASGTALEVASGTGQHVAWFAAAMPGWTWQPSDVDGAGFDTIRANTGSAGPAGVGLVNVRAPIELDVLLPAWTLAGSAPLELRMVAEAFDLVYCANMLHISPWATCAALMQGAALRLAPGGVLITYGPYFEDAVPTSPGNSAFDHSLRSSNPSWGLRRREDVEAAAAQAGLTLQARHAMPSNNLLLIFGRTHA